MVRLLSFFLMVMFFAFSMESKASNEEFPMDERDIRVRLKESRESIQEELKEKMLLCDIASKHKVKIFQLKYYVFIEKLEWYNPHKEQFVQMTLWDALDK